MRFSGERYMPSVQGETRYEHMHRYGLCLAAVKDKAVLDIASGAGYGSAILASAAKSVVGVDVSAEAVEHAKETYGDIRNLKYIQGDATNIPFPKETFDVVVSFETIEHLLPQTEMVAEIRRVLKPDGVLIISSPNRPVYSDKFEQNNPYHLKELDFDEFDALLKVKFPAVRYFSQRLARASFIYPHGAPDASRGSLDSLIDGPQGLERREPALVDPVYFVAVAARSDVLLPDLSSSVLLSDDDAVSREMLSLSDMVVERDGRLAQLYAANEQAEARYVELTRHAQALSDDVTERDGRLYDLYKAVERFEADRRELDRQIVELTERVGQRDISIEALSASSADLRREKVQLEEQIATRLAELDLAAAAADRARTRSAQVGQEIAALRDELLEREIELTSTQRALEKARGRAVELAGKASGLTEELADRDQLAAEMQAAQKRAVERADTLLAQAAALREQLDAKAVEIIGLGHERQAAQRQVQALEQALDAAREEARQRVDGLQDRLDEQVRILGQAEALLEAAELRAESAEQDLAKAGAQADAAGDTVARLLEEIEQWKLREQEARQALKLKEPQIRSDYEARSAEAIATASREATVLQAALEAKAAELGRAQAALREQDQFITMVLASTSWAVSRPVRVAGRLVRAAQRRLKSAARRLMPVTPAQAASAIPAPIAAVEVQAPRAADPTPLAHAAGVELDQFTAEQHLLEGSILFDPAWYLERYSDVAAANVTPTEHYLASGAREGRDPGPHFSTAWYLRNYSDVAGSDCNPLVHFLLYGEAEGRSPSGDFDTAWYHASYPDVRQAGLNGVVHYVLHGQAEGRRPSPNTPASLDELCARLPGEMLPYFERLKPYDAWMSVNDFTPAQAADLRAALAARKGRLPLISLITPVYNTPESLLREMVRSVLDQVHDGWELCLVDDASPSPHVAPLLSELAALDDRIKVKRLKKNGGISVATNAAVEMAKGEIIAFLDHDDLITPDCVGELALYYADHPEADVVYSDDDKIDTENNRFAPQFKPDWSPALLLSYMYMSHVFSVRRSLFRSLGGFKTEFDGSQDYEFALRATEQARHVGHIPRVLYHWRVVPGSTAASGDAKPESFEAGRKGVQNALDRRGVAAKAVHPDWALKTKVGMFGIEFPDQGPEVTIIIPTYNQVGYLKTCVESLARTTYENFRVLVVDNDSDDPETLAYMAKVAKRPGHSVVRIPKLAGKFSFAALMNKAVEHATTEYVLLLNNDTEVINPRWLSQMVGYGRMDGVGAVGARLYFEDHTIQHAGIVHGYHEGLVGHAFRNAPPHDWGYMGFVRTAREYSAVTAACVLTPLALFKSLNGFDEKNFAVAYNDVDYGYRVVQAGYRCVYCADAELFHYEGKSRPKKDDPREVVAMRRIYGDWRDAWYNPNLSLENENFEPALKRLAGRNEGPVQVVFVSHNLNHEGAPNTLCDLVIGLVQAGVVQATVLSPGDRPLRAAYEAAGVSVRLFDAPPQGGAAEPFLDSCRQLGQLFRALGAQVVVANTLPMYFATTAAREVGLPTIWCQHESEPWQSYFDYVSVDVRGYAYAAFAQTYRMTYVADATRRGWRDLETRGNFRVIRHGIPQERLDAELNRWNRAEARAAIGAEPEDVVIALVGTVCARKGQQDLVDAFKRLPKAVQARARLFIAGAHVEKPYADELLQSLTELDPSLADRIVVTGAVPDTIVYYAAADIYVCTSRIESAPRVIVEAMAFGLPIITTPVFGIPELVDENINALFYQPGEIDALAALLESLIEDEALRARLASRSVDSLNSRPGFAEMVQAYGEAIRQAAMLETAYEAAEILAPEKAHALPL